VGAAVAYVLLVKIMDIAFVGSLPALLQAALIAAVSMAVFGLIGTLRVLSAKVAPHLRAE
jgi:putative ABC transport system permease protein